VHDERNNGALAGFDDLRSLPLIQIWDTVAARTVHGERQSLAVVELDPNAVVPEHQHDNEQLGMVITGSLRFRIGEETRDLGPGETWSIPSNAPHEVVAGPEGAVVIDVFAPARADWLSLERTGERPPRWP
jgi:quercetin dioxygenase-like cupin family protein